MTDKMPVIGNCYKDLEGKIWECESFEDYNENKLIILMKGKHLTVPFWAIKQDKPKGEFGKYFNEMFEVCNAR